MFYWDFCTEPQLKYAPYCRYTCSMLKLSCQTITPILVKYLSSIKIGNCRSSYVTAVAEQRQLGDKNEQNNHQHVDFSSCNLRISCSVKVVSLCTVNAAAHSYGTSDVLPRFLLAKDRQKPKHRFQVSTIFLCYFVNKLLYSNFCVDRIF
jgi:hypothetical protein